MPGVAALLSVARAPCRCQAYARRVGVARRAPGRGDKGGYKGGKGGYKGGIRGILDEVQCECQAD